MYDTIAESLHSPTGCDVRELAERVLANAERRADSPESHVDGLERDIHAILLAVGPVSDHNDRYRALCLQLLLQERIVELCVRGAHQRLRYGDRSKRMRNALHAAVGTLRQMASAMTGRFFVPTGGLTMTSADDLLARADRLAQAVIATEPRGLLAVSGATEPAHLALACGEKGLGPWLRAFEFATTRYEDAASRFRIASGAADGSFDVRACTVNGLEKLWQDKGLSPGGRRIFLRAFDPVVSGLSRSYVNSGRPGDARRAAMVHLDVARQLNDDVQIVTAELQIAAADEHLDHGEAIERLERVLSDERTTRLLLRHDRVIRLRVIDAMGRLALLLMGQGATAARQHWVAAAQAWLEGSGTAYVKVAMKRITDADVWQHPDTGTGWDATPSRRGIVAPPSRGGMANPAEAGGGRALFYLCRDINAYVRAQHIPALVAALARLAAMLLDRGRQIGKRSFPERAAELGQVVRNVDAWRPALRASHLTGPLPERWLADTSREAMHVAELCWEFADRYCPAVGLPALKTAGRAALRVYGGPGTKQHLAYWLDAATRAHQLGDWRFEVTAQLKVAWSCSTAEPPRRNEAIRAAGRAYRAMRAGFERLANLYEVTTLLDKEWAVYPARIARAFARDDPESWEAFSALDFGQGLALSAMRSADSATSHELVALQHEEQQLFTTLTDLDRLSKVRDRILDLTRRGGSLLLAQSDPWEQTQLLWALGEDAAIIQLGKTRDDVVASAARLVDGRVVYHTLELGKYKQVAGLMRRMWRAVNINPVDEPGRSLANQSALDEAYGVLVAPLQEFLAGATSWHVVAHDELAGLPVHAIRNPQGRFLIETVAIGYAPSVKALAETTSPGDVTGPALVIGLTEEPATGHEVRDIAHIIEDAGVDVVAADDGPGWMLNGQRQWRVVHIVAHGESHPFPDALTSYLEFGSIHVTAQEVLDHGVHAGLVFINACHLANSSPFGGDLYGFPFAFLATGTPVIAAAAPIYRPYASWFAQDLHRELLAGRTPLDAYARTVRSFIADPWQRHPVYWAPYFYVGGC